MIIKTYKINLIILLLIGICSTLDAQRHNIINYTTSDGLCQNAVYTLVFDENNQLWIGTNGGLCVFDGKSFFKSTHEKLSPRITNLLKDKNGQIHILDEYDNFFINKSEKNKIKSSSAATKDYNLHHLGKINYRNFNRLRNFGYQDIIRIQKNDSIYNENILKLNIYGKTYQAIFWDSLVIDMNSQWFINSYKSSSKPQQLKTTLPKDFARNGLIFKSDQNLFCLYHTKIYQLEMRNDSLVHQIILSDVALDKTKDYIQDGKYDERTGYFYFGSALYGLYVVKPELFEVLKVLAHLNENENYNQIYFSQAEISPGKILVNNEVILDELGNSQYMNVQKPIDFAMNYIDKQKNTYYSDGGTIVIKNKTSSYAVDMKFNDYVALSMCMFNDSMAFICSHKQIKILKNRKEVIEFPNKIIEKNNEKNFKYLYKPERDSSAYLLTNRSIYKINPLTKEINKINNLPICDYRIMTSLHDSLSFVGTYGQGYFLKKGNQFYAMPLDKKGHLKFAHAALYDDNGYVWISTNNGLFRTRLQDIKDYISGKSKNIFYFYYDKSSGFLTNEFNGGCQSPAFKLRDGRFSFSSMDGLVQFDPLKVPAYFPGQPLQIVGLSLNEQEQDSVPSILSITQDISDIKLELSTTYYGHLDNLVIQYRIKGYVETWKDLTDKRYITLQNASHGNIQIEIRKRNGFGLDAYDYMTYPIQVLPFFYQTWWFISILFLIGFLLTYLFSRWYNRYMIQKNIELEKLIVQKNEGLIQINQNLTEQIKQNDLFQSIFVHDIKSPIRFIQSNSNLLRQHWNQIDQDIKIDHITHIHEAASQISHFIEDTLIWINIRNKQLTLLTNTEKVSTLLLNTIALYKKDEKVIQNKIVISTHCPDDLQWKMDIRLLEALMRNLLSNSIKYSSRGQIFLYAKLNPDGTKVIGCRDDGKGMPQDVVETILSDQYQGNDLREDSLRMGYVIIKEITSIIGGKLYIQSQMGKGTDVWVEF